MDQINSHRLSKAEDVERRGRARGREEKEEEEERDGKSFERHHDAEEVETVCQTENRDTEVKVSFRHSDTRYCLFGGQAVCF